MVAERIFQLAIGCCPRRIVVGGYGVVAIPGTRIGIVEPLVGEFRVYPGDISETACCEAFVATKQTGVERGLVMQPVERFCGRIVSLGTGESDTELRRNPVGIVAVEKFGIGTGSAQTDGATIIKVPVSRHCDRQHLLLVGTGLIRLGDAVVVQRPDVVAVVAVEGEQVDAVLRTVGRVPLELDPRREFFESGQVILVERCILEVAVARVLLHG